MANFLGTVHTKFYQNQPCFVEDMTKIFWCVIFSVHNVHRMCSLQSVCVDYVN